MVKARNVVLWTHSSHIGLEMSPSPQHGDFCWFLVKHLWQSWNQNVIIHYFIRGSIPHAIAFGMCHVVSKSIPHDHVVCILAMWYAFSTMWYDFSKPAKCQFRIFKGHKWLNHSVSFGTAGHPRHGVWCHTPHTHLVFSIGNN